MLIADARIHCLRIPFEDGSSGEGLMPSRWTHLDMVLLRLETSEGLVGWGEAFSYSCRTATAAALQDMVLPLVVGQTVTDVATFTRTLQQKLHLQGRFGITSFALSAVDIALVDLASREAGQSVAQWLGGVRRTQLPAYASLVRYGDPRQVAQFVGKALAQGYQSIKLHEITGPAIAAAREAAPTLPRLVTDVNCNWSMDEARRLLPAMRDLDLYWVEEPVYPPDDAKVLASLQQTFGVAMASGENAATREGFRELAGAIRFVQPSVTKVGGITELVAVCELARERGSVVMPHSPYFGPGYWATLQVMAARDECELFEYLFVEPQAWLDSSIPLPGQGSIQVPQGPGLGFEPEPALLKAYAA